MLRSDFLPSPNSSFPAITWFGAFQHGANAMGMPLLMGGTIKSKLVVSFCAIKFYRCHWRRQTCQSCSRGIKRCNPGCLGHCAHRWRISRQSLASYRRSRSDCTLSWPLRMRTASSTSSQMGIPFAAFSFEENQLPGRAATLPIRSYSGVFQVCWQAASPHRHAWGLFQSINDEAAWTGSATLALGSRHCRVARHSVVPDTHDDHVPFPFEPTRIGGV